MKNLFLILLVILFVSCSSKLADNEIELINKHTFTLDKGESINPINEEIKDLYNEYFNNKKNQIPLFKYIYHSNYKILIGLPINTTLEQMIEYEKNNKDSLVTEFIFKNDSVHFCKKYKKDNLHLTEYGFRFDDMSLFYISVILESESFSNEINIFDRLK